MKKYILSIITLLITILTTIFIIKLNILPNKYLLLTIIIETLLLLIGTILKIQKNKIIKVLGIVILTINIIINIIGIYYINSTTKFIHKNFTGDIVYNSGYYLITTKENKINNLEEVKEINYYKYSKDIELAKETLGEYNYKEQEKIEIKENDIFLIDVNNYKLLKEEYKIIHEFNIEIKEKRNTTAKETYNIYIGGRDFTRTLMDFNMIITINTKTNTILLTSIPRDYYIYMREYNQNDSLEYMGILGEKTITNSLEDLLDIKIDYYASVYTDGLVEIVDILGGIEYCSDMQFTTTHSMIQDSYDDSYGEKLTINKGCQHLNGIQTLTLARERKNVGSDRQRQKNCRQILKAILEKSISTTTLTNYNELLSKVSNLYQTNINEETITTLIKSLINDKYTIIEQSLEGTDSYGYIRLNTTRSYIMIPQENSVTEVKEKIKQTLSEE